MFCCMNHESEKSEGWRAAEYEPGNRRLADNLIQSNISSSIIKDCHELATKKGVTCAAACALPFFKGEKMSQEKERSSVIR